jgi:hypothetical protein
MMILTPPIQHEEISLSLYSFTGYSQRVAKQQQR